MAMTFQEAQKSMALLQAMRRAAAASLDDPRSAAAEAQVSDMQREAGQATSAKGTRTEVTG